MASGNNARFAAIVAADGMDERKRPAALTDVDGAPRIALVTYGLEAPGVAPKILIRGCGSDEVWATINTPGWELVESPNWQAGPVAGVRAALQGLPLVDAFFLAVCDGQPNVTAGASVARRNDVLQRLTSAYLAARARLGRIIVPHRGGIHCWPWLIDIGFRQPFVELPDDGRLDDVIAANVGQVVAVDVD